MEWTGQHYADAALEYALGPWILRRLPPLDLIEGFCFFGPPSLPALWWTRRVLLPLARRRIPCLYFCYEPPRYAYSDTAAISRRLVPLGARLGPVAALYKGIDRRMVRAADALLGNSPFAAGLLERAYDRRAIVLPHGVDFAPPAPGAVAAQRAAWGLGNRRVALTVNHLHPRKRVDWFLRAVRGALDAGAPVGGVVVGGGPERSALEALADELGLGDSVRFAGFVPEAELPAVYAAADIYVHTGVQESFGLSVIEAAAAGLPVVAVAEGGPCDTVQEGRTGLLVPSTPDAVAAGLARLATHPAAAAAMGWAGAAFIAASYQWEHGAAVFFRVLADRQGRIRAARRPARMVQ
jgi:glycosyltransferase involved in cell wall biosynthesis